MTAIASMTVSPISCELVDWPKFGSISFVSCSDLLRAMRKNTPTNPPTKKRSNAAAILGDIPASVVRAGVGLPLKYELHT